MADTKATELRDKELSVLTINGSKMVFIRNLLWPTAIFQSAFFIKSSFDFNNNIDAQMEPVAMVDHTSVVMEESAGFHHSIQHLVFILEGTFLASASLDVILYAGDNTLTKIAN